MRSAATVLLLLCASPALAADDDGDGWQAESTGGYDCDDGDASVLPWHCDDGDLVIDGVSMTLAGNLTRSQVWIVNGGRLRIRPASTAGGGGFLRLVADAVYVDASSMIDGTGSGYRGGVGGNSGAGPGGGGTASVAGGATLGGGGGHGGVGERGRSACHMYGGRGGFSYGSESDRRLHLGSGGGGGLFAAGGPGGGALAIVADQVWIDGTLSVRGALGPLHDSSDIGGSGAGGEILLEVGALVCSGSILAEGGDSNGTGAYFANGGAGGGGRIQVWATELDMGACTVSAAAGASACLYSLPGDGTVWYAH